MIELTLADLAVVASMCPVSRVPVELRQTPPYRKSLRKVPGSLSPAHSKCCALEL